MLAAVCKVWAQEQPDKKQLADRLFERYEYARAVNMYLDLADRNRPDVKLLERIGDCYRLMGNYRTAEQWYATASVDGKAAPLTTFLYAETLLHNNKVGKAREQYRLYYEKVKDLPNLQKKWAMCDSAEKWMAAELRFIVKNVKKFNTSFSEWGLTSIGADSYVFTSNRSANSYREQDKTDPRTGLDFFNLFSVRNDTLVPVMIDTKNTKLFNGDYHAGLMVVSPDGKTAYITVTTNLPKAKMPTDKCGPGSLQRLYSRRLQLVIATRTASGWGNLQNFAWNDAKKFSVGHAALSPDGDTLYFTSDMPGGYGKTDIWYSMRQPDGTWAKPLNCGPRINTPDEEAFPAIGGDGALYFSSKGLPGMGGFDIYRAVGTADTWKDVMNLKYPMNSTADDLSVLTDDGTIGYLSSDREGGMGGDDIYQFVKKPEVTPPPLVPQKPLAARPDPSIVKGKLHTVIYFDLDKDNIRADAIRELDKLILAMQQNPKWRLRLTSFTDARAANDYNIGLSQRRTASVVKYLTDKGIAPIRLIGNWDGENELVNQCTDGVECTEAQHQLNRRTEIYTFAP